MQFLVRFVADWLMVPVVLVSLYALVWRVPNRLRYVRYCYIYVYDGTWNGMMTLVHRTARDGALPDDILRFSPNGSSGVLLDSTEVRSDPSLAEATAAVLEERLGRR